MRRAWSHQVGWIAFVLGCQFIAAEGAHAQRGPTAEEYVRIVGSDARLVPAGELVLADRKVSCGHRPTVLHDRLDDHGAAYPGFIILNPTLLEKVSNPVKLWIYAHECGHQFRGPNEEAADCFAVQRGRRQGWLTPDGLEQLCRYMAPKKSNNTHFSGPERCLAMRECYADKTAR
jgi:hypothetical protein